MTRRPAYSPCEPAWAASIRPRSRALDEHLLEAVDELAVTPRWSAGAKGCRFANSGQVTGIISLVAFSFIVHEPSGIMERSSAMSLSASRRR